MRSRAYASGQLLDGAGQTSNALVGMGAKSGTDPPGTRQARSRLHGSGREHESAAHPALGHGAVRIAGLFERQDRVYAGRERAGSGPGE
jgi:hypothetical protein